MARVFVLGMAVMDVVFNVPEFPKLAEKYRADDAVFVGGGCAANAAFAIARLDGDAQLAARLGDDHVGAMILSDLAAVGVDVSHCHRAKGGKSSFSSVLVDAAGERQIVNFRGHGLVQTAGWIMPDAEAVLVDNRWADGAKVALAWAKRTGVPGVVDAEAPVEGETLEMASYVAFSKQGLEDFSGHHDHRSALYEASKMLPGRVCVTDGAKGCFWLEGGSMRHMPAFQVDVQDTLAAGDIWHGAFALRLAEKATMEDAIRFANATAALKCMHFGGRAGCPDRKTVEAFIREKQICN